MDMNPYLKQMVEKGASDLFMTVGMPISVRIHGEIMELTDKISSDEEVKKGIFSLMKEEQKNEFLRTHESNFAVGIKDIGRFRVSSFIQRTSPGCVIRHINNIIPSIDELKLPPIVKALSMIKRGLVLVVGSTGMGKTTTLAAMIDAHNRMSKGHILTIEDPVEYLHTHKKCIITQREVGMDTDSFDIALKNAMRQSPDVIEIGEIRDAETMKYALTFAETGHLCLATLHANNTSQALERIAHFFSANARSQLWMDLSLNLRAILAQRLVSHVNRKERIPAIEVLINAPVVSSCIRKGNIHNLQDYVSRNDGQGMQSFDQSLFRLYLEGLITEEEALKQADSQNNVRLMIKLNAPVSEVIANIKKIQRFELKNKSED